MGSTKQRKPVDRSESWYTPIRKSLDLSNESSRTLEKIRFLVENRLIQKVGGLDSWESIDRTRRAEILGRRIRRYVKRAGPAIPLFEKP